LICNFIIICVSEIISPEDEMQFWSITANSAGRKDEKDKGTAFWYALEPLVKDFRHVSLCSFRIWTFEEHVSVPIYHSYTYDFVLGLNTAVFYIMHTVHVLNQYIHQQVPLIHNT